MLKGLGVTSFAQVASWTAADVAEMDGKLGAFAGRITRDNWVDQAQLLSAGDVTGFEKKYGALGSEIKR
jgi:predicted flap endonuclease-1-like 5' DNA nuclease